MKEKAGTFKQIENANEYFGTGYPRHNGLVDSACIIRNHRDPLLQMVMSDWWAEYEKYPIRDQLSFGYACWKNDFEYDLCDLDLTNNSYVKPQR